jgi:hypothetical protein
LKIWLESLLTLDEDKHAAWVAMMGEMVPRIGSVSWLFMARLWIPKI